jgi:hypothetical protein
MAGFRVPYGVGSDSQLRRPDDAAKGEPFSCPSCQCQLVLRAGQRRPHFAHKSSAVCTGETVLHQIAKMLVRDAVLRARAGLDTLTLEHPCVECRQLMSVPFPTDRITDVRFESRVANDRIVDVLLLEGEVPRFAIEILATHAVDEPKAADLDVHWAELRAVDVVDNPARWKAVNGRIKSNTCRKCRATASVQAEIVARICRRWNIEVSGQYTARPAHCWSCESEVLYLSWNAEIWPDAAPPQPRPHILQWRHSSMLGRHYWASTCPQCHVLQGDFYEAEATAEFFYAVTAKEIDRRIRAAAS